MQKTAFLASSTIPLDMVLKCYDWAMAKISEKLKIICFFVRFALSLQEIWIMTYLNQFHREAVERKLRKIVESMKSPMNSVDAANYMKRNFEMAKNM